MLRPTRRGKVNSAGPPAEAGEISASAAYNRRNQPASRFNGRVDPRRGVNFAVVRGTYARLFHAQRLRYRQLPRSRGYTLRIMLGDLGMGGDEGGSERQSGGIDRRMSTFGIGWSKGLERGINRFRWAMNPPGYLKFAP